MCPKILSSCVVEMLVRVSGVPLWFTGQWNEDIIMFDSTIYSLFNSILTRMLSLACLGVFLAHSATAAPRIHILDAQPVQDSLTNQMAFFDVVAIYEPYLIECQPSQPNCNTKQLSFCVGYNAGSGTATVNTDFQATSGQLSKTVIVDGPDEILIGTIAVPVISDSITEGTEAFNVTLTSGVGCTNNGALETFVAVGTIIDGVQSLPDLAVTDIVVKRTCQLGVTLKNSGAGTVPDSAYDPTSGAIVEMKMDGIAWGGVRLFIADPSRALQTPGASVTYAWFPGTPNLLLPAGLHNVEATVDRANSVVEAIETNNARRERMSCFGG
jgi:hypothetical protein